MNLLIKNYIASNDSNSMILVDSTEIDVKNILYNRVFTNIVLWDITNKWKEERIIGSLDIYAQTFFEEYEYKKLTVDFLMYNLNIWYLEEPYEGNRTICGDLLTIPIDKCIIFVMKSNELRGNISLDEVQKIIYLSKIMDDYKLSGEYMLNERDEHGRKIIHTKYKILNKYYKKYA